MQVTLSDLSCRMKVQRKRNRNRNTNVQNGQSIFDNSSAFCSAGTLDVAEATALSQNICRLLEQNFGLSSAASNPTLLMLYGGVS